MVKIAIAMQHVQMFTAHFVVRATLGTQEMERSVQIQILWSTVLPKIVTKSHFLLKLHTLKSPAYLKMDVTFFPFDKIRIFLNKNKGISRYTITIFDFKSHLKMPFSRYLSLKLM